jgi:hypothetical protein
MRLIIAFIVTAYASITANSIIEASDIELILEFAETEGVYRAGQFSAFRSLSGFSGEKIARLHELAARADNVEPIIEKMMQTSDVVPMEATPDKIKMIVVNIFRDFDKAYEGYTAFQDELRTHPETFAISRRDLLIIRTYFREFGKLTSIERFMRSESFLRSTDEASKIVLCKWFKIGIRELSRQVPLYIPGWELGEEITGFPHLETTFDKYSELCHKMLM